MELLKNRIDGLHQHLAQYLAQKEYVKPFVFLDTRAEPSLIKQVLQLDPGARFHVLYEDIAAIEPSPALVALSSLDSPFLNWLIKEEEAYHRAFCVLMLSPLELEAQIDHWRSVLFVRDPEDQATLAFPYYDPRALTSYLVASTPQERSAFLDPAERVYLHAQGSRWLCIDNPHPSVMRGQVAREAPWLRLRPEHIQVADAQAALTFSVRVLEYLNKHSANYVSSLPSQLAQRMILGGLKKARAYGLQDAASVLAFVQMQFEIAPNFDRQPAIQAALTAPDVVPGERIEHLLRHTSEADWEQAEAGYDAEAWEM